MNRPGIKTSELQVGLGIHAATAVLIEEAARHGHYGWAVAALAVSGGTHAVYCVARAVTKAAVPFLLFAQTLWTYRRQSSSGSTAPPRPTSSPQTTGAPKP